jgi:hypothetical protein
MVPAEAVDVFERTLCAGDRVEHLTVSTGLLIARLAQWVLGDIHEQAEDGVRYPRPELDTPFVEPAAGTEALLAEIWSRGLRIEPIGANDNFFELGGHSLLAVNITTRIRRSLGCAIPVTGMLEQPTVRLLAAMIDAGGPPDAALPDPETAAAR